MDKLKYLKVLIYFAANENIKYLILIFTKNVFS